MKRLAALAIVVCIAGSFLFAQSASTSSADVTAADAQPYDPSEFPQWSLDVRRAEIVALGSLPFTLLASRLLYGIGRFVVQSLIAGAIVPEYLPSVFAPPNAIPMTRTDNAWILTGSFSLSAVIATIDYFLGRDEQQQ